MIRKIVGAAILLLLTGTGLVYLLVPRQLNIQKETLIRANINAAAFYYRSAAKMLAWWPGNMEADSTLQYNGYRFSVTKRYEDGADIVISKGDWQQPSVFSLIATGKDSMILNWKLAIPTGMNPIGKLRKRYEAAELKLAMDSIVANFRRFTENTENTYGITVSKGKFTDSILVTSSWYSPEFPTTEKIYEEIAGLEHLSAQHNATITNVPMLHISKDEQHGYNTMVAIPVNKEVPVGGQRAIKRLFTGNTLITEVKGGYATVAIAEKRFERYKIEYSYVSPAVPFQSLVSNRLLVKDSSQWITRLYYPIF